MNIPIPDNLIDQLLASVRQEDISASQAIKYIDRVLSTFRRIGLVGQDDASVLRLLGNIGESYEVLGSLEKAQELYQEALHLALSQQDQGQSANLHWKIGRVYRKRNLWNDALQHISQSRQLYDIAQETKGVGRTWVSEGLVLANLGKYPEASQAYHSAIALAEQINEESIVADASVNLGILASIQGDFEKAFLLYQNSLPYYEQAQKAISIARTYHNIGLTQSARSLWPEALDAFEKSITIAQEKGDLILTALNYIHKAAVYLSLNDRTLVATYCARGLETFKEVDYPLGIAETYKVLGQLYTQKQDWATAQGLLNESLRLCQQYEKPLGMAEVNREIGKLHMAQNKIELARDALQAASEQFLQLNAQHDATVTQQLLDTL